MPRAASHTTDTLTDAALLRFWRHGYSATSVDDLVAATGVSRHGIYSGFGGKRALYLACFARYSRLVVTPAISQVEDRNEGVGGGLAAIGDYFAVQIARAEAGGLPGPGCFVANAATETAPHDAAVAALVAAHNERLRAAFAKALQRPAAKAPDAPSAEALADAIVVFATGLWSLSRVENSAAALREATATFLGLVRDQMA